MRKSFFIICFLILAASLSAQVSGGPIIGISAAQFDGDTYGGYHKLFPTLGGFAYYRFNDNFALQPEIMYIQKGGRAVIEEEGVFYHMKLNYIDVPLMFNLRLPIVLGSNTTTLEFQVGPTAGLLLSAKLDYEAFGLPIVYDNSDITETLKKFDLAGSGGVNYYFTEHMSFCYRFCYSMISVEKGTGNYLPGGSYNNYMHFTLRYAF